MSRARVAFELARPALLFGAYVVLAMNGIWLLAVPVAVACFLASFVLQHDTIHSSLGLSRAANELTLTLSGLLLLKSGHGQRATHLRHHGKLLAEDDPEGSIVHWPFWRVVLAGPFYVLGGRAAAMRLSPPTRRHQIAETAATVLVAAGMVLLYVRTGSLVGLVYWAVVFVLSATTALWGAYIPHSVSPDDPLVRRAAALSAWWTPVLNTFAFHDLHHRFPRVPTALLPDFARAVGPEVAFAPHEHPEPVRPVVG